MLGLVVCIGKTGIISPPWVVSVGIQITTLIIIMIVNTLLSSSSGEDHLVVCYGMPVYSINLIVENRWSSRDRRSCQGYAYIFYFLVENI